MKKYYFLFALTIYGSFLMAQSNTFPTSGNVGIGTTSPTLGTLQINDINSSDLLTLVSMDVKVPVQFNAYNNPDFRIIQRSNGLLTFWTNTIERMRISAAGNVGIGTLTPTEKLSVNGKIRAHEIKVETANWPDYVFEKDYQLLTLQETENHIKEKGHLPGIPSAAEVKVNGIDLGEMNTKLLQKIEELTLYLIKMEKDNQEMKQLIKFQDDKYSREIKDLKSKIN